MKIASTDTLAQQAQQKKAKAQEQSRNFRIAVLSSTFMRISFALADPTTVLSAFVYKLTTSNVLVGLAGSMMPVGWMWPQLLTSNLLEHRPRKMPFYMLGMSVHTTVWLMTALSTFLIGSNYNSLLTVSFICLYFIGTSSMGVASVPYMDIVSKTIEPQRRARFFSLGNFIGGIFTIFIGFLVRYILGNESGLPFPSNYALLFGGVVVTVGFSFGIFLKIREPIRSVQTKRRTLRQHLKQGPRFLRTDRNYRWFVLYRICTNVARMCTPFYVPYALLKLAVPDSTIGLFLAVSAISGVLSNPLWGYMGEQYGVRWILISTSLLACTAPLMAWVIQYFPAQWQVPCYFLTFVLNGASMSGMMVGFMAYTLNIAPPMNRPTYLGFLNTVLFPFGFMPVLAGKLVGVIDYEGTFAIAVGMGALAFLTTTQLKDVYHEEETVQ